LRFRILRSFDGVLAFLKPLNFVLIEIPNFIIIMVSIVVNILRIIVGKGASTSACSAKRHIKNVRLSAWKREIATKQSFVKFQIWDFFTRFFGIWFKSDTNNGACA
jgi:hypothetical protein